MSDDAGELDAIKHGVRWYAAGGDARTFVTKGAAIAHAWTLTEPGEARPDVKKLEPAGSVVDEDAIKRGPAFPKNEVKITVDSGDDDDVVWDWHGEIASASWRSAPTVTIELVLPYVEGASQEMMYETLRNTLHGEARARGLELISDATLELFTDGMRADVKVRATAKARAKT